MKATTAIVIATLYLLVFIISIHTLISDRLTYGLFVFSPIMLIWLAITVLRDRSEKYPEMNEDQEWGYFHK